LVRFGKTLCGLFSGIEAVAPLLEFTDAAGTKQVQHL